MRAGTAFSAGAQDLVGVGLQALLVTMTVVALALATASVVGSAPAGAHTVLAAKGSGGGGTSSSTAWISLAGVDGNAASVLPSLGSAVTFAVGYPRNVNNPRVEVLCYRATDPSGLAFYDLAHGYLVLASNGPSPAHSRRCGRAGPPRRFESRDRQRSGSDAEPNPLSALDNLALSG